MRPRRALEWKLYILAFVFLFAFTFGLGLLGEKMRERDPFRPQLIILSPVEVGILSALGAAYGAFLYARKKR